MRKRIISILLPIFMLLTIGLPVIADECFSATDQEVTVLIERAFDIYDLIYEDEAAGQFLVEKENDRDFLRDEYCERASAENDTGNYIRLEKEFRTSNQLKYYCRKYFSDSISDRISSTSTVYLRIIDGQIVFLYDAKAPHDYSRSSDPTVKKLSESGNSAIYSYEFVEGMDSENKITKTFEITKTENGLRITGGSFVSDILKIRTDNPVTGDLPIIAAALTAILSATLCVALIIRYRRILFKLNRGWFSVQV